MQVYSSTIAAFLAKAHRMAAEILSEECLLKFSRTRFWARNLSWPLHLVCFEGEARLAYFDARYLHLGLNKKLIWQTKDSVLRDILRHELAHYLCHIFYPQASTAHRAEFQLLCRQYHWNSEIACAQMNMEEANFSKEGDIGPELIVSKVKKLLALAESGNPHEAELAMRKANELLLKHHLENFSACEQNEHELFLTEVLVAKKKSSKLTAIYEILGQFLVRPWLHYGRGEIRLMAGGGLSQVKLAQYITNFLDRELDQLWKQHQKENGLSGLRAKNSFFIGVAQGFVKKLSQDRANLSSHDQKALIVSEKKLSYLLTEALGGGLSASYSRQQTDGRAQSLGHLAGSKMKIRQAVETSTSTRGLLTYD